MQSDTAPTSTQLARALKKNAPKGWRIVDKVRSFTSRSLYEQINGRAEFYIAYDMRGMTFANYENKADKNLSLNVSLYDMGTPLNAFGVFSGERTAEDRELEIGRVSYLSGANLYIWHGQYYLQIIAFETNEKLISVGMHMAKELTQQLPDPGTPIWGLEMLPSMNLDLKSVKYFLGDAMGLHFMKNTFTAQYRTAAGALTVFLSRNESADAARGVLTQFAEYATRYGKGSTRITEENVGLLLNDMGFDYDIVFQTGLLTAGVTAVPDRKIAIQAAINLWKHLTEEVKDE